MTDASGARAVALATNADQWPRAETQDGCPAYLVPSTSDTSARYVTTETSCSCLGFAHHAHCVHRLAVQLHCTLMREKRSES
jgi:hypothetical protein